MAYTLGNKCVKNLCKRIVLLQLIIEKVVTCFLEHSVYIDWTWEDHDNSSVTMIPRYLASGTEDKT